MAGLGEALDVTCWAQERLTPLPRHSLGVFPPHTLSAAEPWAVPPPYTSFLSRCLLSILPSVSLAILGPSLGLPASSCLCLLSSAWLSLTSFGARLSLSCFPLPRFVSLSCTLHFFLSVSPSLRHTGDRPSGCLAKPALMPCLAFPLPDRAGGHTSIHGGGHVSRGPTVGGRVGGAADLPAGELGRGSCFP